MNQKHIRMLVLVAVAVGLGAVGLKVWGAADAAHAAGIHPAFGTPPNALATPPPGALPDAWWTNTVALASADHALWLLLALVLLALLVALVSPKGIKGLRAPAACLAGHLLTLPAAGVALAFETSLSTFGHIRFLGVLLQDVAVAGMLAVSATDLATRLFRRELPKILMDIILAGAYLAIGLTLLSQAGFNISGIIATSAVLTAVIGFSLQDTLANLMGGLVLEVENLINVGDWIRVGDVVGQVTQIRWRQTTLQTRNWELAVVPNSVIMKNHVLVYGHRDGRKVPQRRWVWFSVNLSSSPTLVMETVQAAVSNSPMENVATDPRPNVVLMDFKDGVGTYALRYFLLDIGPDDPTDSRVRERIYVALQRAGIRLAAPHRELEVREESEERLAARARREEARQLMALRKVELFKVLEPAELEELAHSITHCPFGPGEIVARQGDESDCIYLMAKGNAAVTVTQDGMTRKVAELHDGSLFGEMGVLTGEVRSATVTAVGAVDCWRMDRQVVEGIIKRRPEVATALSRILAERRVDLDAARTALNQDVERSHAVRSAQDDILKRISKFLGLDGKT
jgi:small-conductance mechanosensitive channel/CRP-like cAMP-binding protein